MTIQKALSFLSPYIPAALAVKGLGMVSPELKSFVTSAAAGGYSTDSILGFLRNKLEAPGYSQEQQRLQQGQQQGSLRPDEAASLQRTRQVERIPKAIGAAVSTAGALGAPFATSAIGGVLGAGTRQQQQGDSQQQDQSSTQGPGGFLEFIKQHPELGKFLDGLINKGGSPVQAAAEAKKNKRFAPLIESIENRVGQSFEDLLSQLFQGSLQDQPQQPAQRGVSPAMIQFMAALKEYKNLTSGG